MDIEKAHVIEHGSLYVIWCDGKAHYFQKNGDKAKYFHDCNCQGAKKC